MTLKTILASTQKIIADNSAGILTGLGVAGTVTTAVLAGKAAYSSALIIAAENEVSIGESNGPLDPKQKFQLVWKEFIPPAAVGVVTITSIIMANQIGSRRAAALTAALRLSEELSADYKKKALQTLGFQREEKMRSELARERMEKNPPAQQLLIVDGSDVLMLDERSGRYFRNSVANVRKAVNDINHQVNNYFCASLSDFYGMIGLDATAESDSIGWNTEELLEIQLTPTEYKDQPAFLLGYNIDPISGYDRCS
mgnify:CR=1 FL=1